jgi:hypothetical protein
VFTPHELIERLVALVPRPRAHLTRYFGVFAPAFAARAEIVPSDVSADRERTRATSTPPNGATRRENGALGGPRS